MALARASVKVITRVTTMAARLETKVEISHHPYRKENAKVPSETSLLQSIRGNLDSLSKWSTIREPFTIYRVPEHIRNKNNCIFEPQMVSIGPYHRGAKKFLAIDKQKWRYLQDLLAREGASANLDVIVQKMRDLEEKARGVYSEHVPLSSDEFVEMLVLDGCYIIEFLMKSHERVADSLYNYGWGLSVGKSDFFLMENQIPFFIIEELYDIIFGGSKQPYLLELLAKNVMQIDVHTRSRPDRMNISTSEVQNLLHLYYKWFVPKQVPTKKMKPSPTLFQKCFPNSNDRKLAATEPPKVIPSVTALKEAGVKFQKKKSPRDLFDITFKNGMLEIPYILINNNRKRLFSNLIAFEQSNDLGGEKNLTSFIKFMDMLINTPDDVAILEHCGIIHNVLASADEAASFFHQICECATLDYDKHYLAPVIKDVTDFCNCAWRRFRAMVMHHYFKHPWTIIKFLYACVFIVLSSIQTVAAVYKLFEEHQN